MPAAAPYFPSRAKACAVAAPTCRSISLDIRVAIRMKAHRTRKYEAKPAAVTTKKPTTSHQTIVSNIRLDYQVTPGGPSRGLLDRRESAGSPCRPTGQTQSWPTE